MEEIDRQWFLDWSLGDPDVAFKKYRKWRSSARKTDDEASLRKALEFAAELSRPAIGFYRSEKNQHKLSKLMRAKLDAMAWSLKPGEGHRTPPPPRSERRRGPMRVALLTEIDHLPSARFHFEVWRGLVRAARTHHAALATHEIRKARQLKETARVVRIYDPDAVIYLRLAPTAECLEQLHAAGVAAVLVHADEYSDSPAPRPVLANIVPNHGPITSALRGLILQFLDDSGAKRGAKRGRGPAKQKAVIVAMSAEPGTIRHERVESLKLAFKKLKEFRVEVAPVPDYSFRHALRVLREHDDALVYCCLSDELAVGIRHLIEARSDATARGGGCRPLVIGFDDSQIAHEEGTTSFGLKLDEIGHIALDQVSEWLAERDGDVDKIDFRRIETDVYLAPRG